MLTWSRPCRTDVVETMQNYSIHDASHLRSPPPAAAQHMVLAWTSHWPTGPHGHAVTSHTCPRCRHARPSAAVSTSLVAVEQNTASLGVVPVSMHRVTTGRHLAVTAHNCNGVASTTSPPPVQLPPACMEPARNLHGTCMASLHGTCMEPAWPASRSKHLPGLHQHPHQPRYQSGHKHQQQRHHRYSCKC